jgi:anti-sigma-K factor RskA
MSRASNASRSSRVESPKRFELGLAAVAFCVCGGLAVLFLLFGELEGASWKILTTTVVFGLYSLLALPGAKLLDQGRSSILAWSAVLLAALGLLWAFRIVWSGLDDADGSWRLLVTLTACSTAVSQVCATTARRQATDPASVDRLYAVSNLLVYSLAGIVTLASWNAVDSGALLWRTVGVLAAVDVLSVILQPLLRSRARLA